MCDLERSAGAIAISDDRQTVDHYASQSEEEAVAEDEAAFETRGQTLMEVPTELVPAVRELIAKHTPA